MPIRFNTLLAEAGIAPERVLLVRHQDHRAGEGRSPYALWRDERPSFELYQSHQNVADHRILAGGDIWASFVGTADGGTLFVGLYRARCRGEGAADLRLGDALGIALAGPLERYDLESLPELAEYAGRLVIDWGEAPRVRIQYAERQNKPIVELQRDGKDEKFPGYLDFAMPLSELDRLPHSWITALKAAQGVYVLVGPETREQYVGQAGGTGGFWQRWQDYLGNGHGGNAGLKSKRPSDYHVAILELAPMPAEPGALDRMENRWKQKLKSREMGLNRN